MAAMGLRAELEDRAGDALADLASEAALVALCDGEPTRSALLRATWIAERAAAETFDRWARTDPDDRARSTFASTAAQERGHARRVAAQLGRADAAAPADESPAPGPLHAYLRGLDGSLVRAGAGLVGRPVASLQTYDRIRDFAVAADDDALEACIAGLAADTEASVAAGVTLVDALADGPSAREQALSAAEYAIELVRDDHADALARLEGARQ